MEEIEIHVLKRWWLVFLVCLILLATPAFAEAYGNHLFVELGRRMSDTVAQEVPEVGRDIMVFTPVGEEKAEEEEESSDLVYALCLFSGPRMDANGKRYVFTKGDLIQVKPEDGQYLFVHPDIEGLYLFDQDITAVSRLSYVRDAEENMGKREDRNRMMDFAFAQLGKPYVWGGNGPEVYDCSGFTKACYATWGKSLPRTSEEQACESTLIAPEMMEPGDLVFFNNLGHVGIYVGDGLFIHASSSAGWRQVRLQAFSDYGLPLERVGRVE